MELDGRKLAILKVIIDDYITTGVPVGSRTVSKKPGFDLSSATIRNEMADLEELGYLEQPHTSAGRVPSDKAYRLYVDKLMRLTQLSKEEAKLINEYFSMRMNQIDDVISSAANIISDTTHHISMILTPQIDNIIIRRMQIVRMSDSKALLLIISSSGLVRDSVINIPEGIEDGYLEMLSQVMTENTYGKTLTQAMEYVESRLNGDVRAKTDFLKNALTVLERQENSKSIVLGGTGNMFMFPEYHDVDRAKNFLQVLETKDVLYDMLKKATQMEFTICIGHENQFDELKDKSVVTATYKMGDRALGSFGVIGPTRMDYGKVVSILNHICQSLNNILSSFIEEEKE